MQSVDKPILHLIYIAIHLTSVRVRATLVYVKTVFIFFTFDSCYYMLFTICLCFYQGFRFFWSWYTPVGDRLVNSMWNFKTVLEDGVLVPNSEWSAAPLPRVYDRELRSAD